MILVFPSSDKAAALVRTRINADSSRQALSPSVISEELIGSVLRVRRVLDAISLVVGIAMLGLLGLVGLLSYRARSDEVRTLLKIGAHPSQVAALFFAEYAGVILIGVFAAFMSAWVSSGASDRILTLFT